MKIAVIISLFSRTAAPPELRNQLAQHLADHLVRFYDVASADQAHRCSRDSLDWGADLVMVAGGDGTINGTVRALAVSNGILGIVPAGTANDLARHLQIPTSVTQCCDLVRLGQTRQIDLVKVNDQCLVTVGGVGLTTSAVTRVNSLRTGARPTRTVAQALGASAYGLGLIPSFITLCRNPLGIRIQHNGHVSRHRILSLTVANQPLLGKHFRVSPRAVNDDGYFDIMVIREDGMHRNGKAVLSTLSPNGMAPINVIRLRTSRLLLELDAEAPFVGDGELLDSAVRFDISIQPKSLTVLVPPRR